METVVCSIIVISGLRR